MSPSLELDGCQVPRRVKGVTSRLAESCREFPQSLSQIFLHYVWSVCEWVGVTLALLYTPSFHSALGSLRSNPHGCPTPQRPDALTCICLPVCLLFVCLLHAILLWYCFIENHCSLRLSSMWGLTLWLCNPFLCVCVWHFKFTTALVCFVCLFVFCW